jgi:hypothetical protein
MLRPAPNSISRGIRVALVFVLLCAGCGYRPLGAPRALEGSTSENAARLEVPTRLAVLALRNDSPEPWLDRIVTEALRRELDARGAIDLVNNPASADLVVRGRVRPLAIQSRSFSSFVAALEYSVTIVLDLELVRSSGDVVQLDTAMLTETDIYLASADIETTRTHKLEALRRLSDLLAGRIADSIELLERPIAVVGEGA